MYDVCAIVPVYNIEEYLRPCLDSLLEQGDVSLQVVIIDDGSKDASGTIADEYAQKHQGFEVHHIENGGLGHARNVGLCYADSKYVCFVDSDDVVSKYAYEKMFKRAEADSSDMAICYVDRFNSQKHWKSDLHEKVFSGIGRTAHVKSDMRLLNDTTSWNKLIRLEFLRETGLSFPEKILYEDIPVTIPLHYLANQVSVVQSATYHWRVRDGYSKSITQNVDQITNLQDRLKIMRMLDSFFKTNVAERELHIANQVKHLDVDLKIFVNQCPNVTEEVAYKYLDLINEYIDEAISPEAFERLRLLDQQKYLFVRNRDYESLIKVCGYKEYNDAPVTESDGELYVDLPEDIFTIENRQITPELSRILPRQRLKGISKKEDALILDLIVFRYRINIPEYKDQTLKAYLFDEMSGCEYPISVTHIMGHELTEAEGMSTERYRSRFHDYNYDCTRYELTIDLKEIVANDTPSGDYMIRIEVENRFYEDTFILAPEGGYLAKASGHGFLCDGVLFTVICRPDMRFSLEIDDSPIIATSVSEDDGAITITPKEKVGALYAVCKDGDKRAFERITSLGNEQFYISVNSLHKGKLFEIVATENNSQIGREKRVFIDGKHFRIDCSDSLAVVETNLGSGYLRLAPTDIPAFVTSVQREKKVAKINAEIDSSSLCLKEINSAALYACEDISGQDVKLEEAVIHAMPDGNICCEFNIDFKSLKKSHGLYAGRHSIYILLQDSENNTFKMDPRCVVSCSKTFAFSDMKIMLKRDYEGALFLDVKQIWGNGQETYKKRKRLIVENYPVYLDEPLNEKRILFESKWGMEYSCNPRAIYEYIDKHYPEYECIWSLEDKLTPINGRAKRVRRGSLEYYKCLATSKYLVNNVNFGDDYVKRDGQVFVQTMHGTPLKTLGLQVEDEVQNVNDRMRLIARNRAWDFLVVQGTFMEGIAEDCFGVSVECMKTGYPRTDALYHVDKDKEERIKSEIGIPLNKKVVLYAPTWRRRNIFEMDLDVNLMREQLGDDYILLVRLHYLASNAVGFTPDNVFSFDATKYGSIEDLYLISDVLVTDYSSSMFDYALLKKPMVFYTYDYDEYVYGQRGLYVDFKEEAPGPIVYTTKELAGTILNIDEECGKCRDRISAFYDKYLTYEQANSSRQVVRKMFGETKRIGFFGRLLSRFID